jgi:RHS repeat-associated protein
VGADYVYADDTLLSQQRGGQVSVYLADGQQSIRALADGAGAITDRYDFDAFGNRTGGAGATVNPYLYDGQQLDPTLNLYYLRARYYDPTLARFTARDPAPGGRLPSTDPAPLRVRQRGSREPAGPLWS